MLSKNLLGRLLPRREPGEAPAESRQVDPLVGAAARLLPLGREGQSCLELATPKLVTDHFPDADALLARVKEIVTASGVRLEYFEVSEPRYRHYLAAALSLPRGSRVLELGAAPGHVSIGLHLAGFQVTGVNLNEHWRSTYPSPEWLERLNVIEHDAEKEALPFGDASFDCVLFTEVLEHVAVVDPVRILREIRRVLVPGGLFILSTPNVCNISNVLALLRGQNIFWPPELFYGGLDRHNREYTPNEVRSVVEAAGFRIRSLYGMNSHNNWRDDEGVRLAAELIRQVGDKEPLLRNTIMCLAEQ